MLPELDTGDWAKKVWYINNKDKSRQSCNESRERRIPVLRKIVSEAKDKPCLDCNCVFPDFVMDFDHRQEDTKFKKISYLVKTGYSIETLKIEIAKCDVVCANCHRIRTFFRLERNLNPSQGFIYTKRHRNALYAYTIDEKSKPCMDCNKKYHFSAIDFDHRDPENKFGSISRMISDCVSLEKLKNEISKCDIVCANCHRVRERERYEEWEDSILVGELR